MDAKKTGALIAARRKALGLTQKELAERLMVSDKAVSKWETGAGYPELTLLPLLAETLGITADELLAGELRAADTAPPEPTDAQRKYAAEKLADADDKLLLFGIVIWLLTAYYAFFPYAYQLAPLPAPMLGIVLLAAACIWHNRQCRRLHELYGVDDRVSRRRTRLFAAVGTGAIACLLVQWIGILGMMSGLLPYLSETELWHGRRFDLFLSSVWTTSGEQAAWFHIFRLLPLLPAIVLPVVFAFAYRRMTAETRFRPVLCAVPALLPLLGTAAYIAAVLGLVKKLEPEDYGEPLHTMNASLEAGMEQLALGFRLIWAAVTLLVIAACVVLWRRGNRGIHGVAACAAAQCVLCFFVTMEGQLIRVNTLLSLDNMYSRGEIKLSLGALLTLLLLCVLLWACGTLFSGVRRKLKQPAETEQ